MKYPITARADGYALRLPFDAVATLVDAWRFILRHWGLLAALAITIAVHAPTLRFFFDGDDFVVLGSVEYLGAQKYITDTFFMRDIVPNWRPLTGAVYAAEWELFGLNAALWRAFNLSVHCCSIAVLYTLVARVTKRPSVGALAAVIFGVSGSHFDTVTYITALPHVLATFLVLSSLLAIVSYAQDGERNKPAYALSFVLFALAFLANEGAFIYAPVIAFAYLLFSGRWRASRRAYIRLPLHVAPFAALSTGWFIFYQLADLPQLKFEDYYWGPHVFSNYGVYLSWIAFPEQAIPAEPDAWRWGLAGGMIAVAAFFLVRGPNMARVGVLGIGLALLPFVPVEIWTASRYTYAAVAFFAPIAAIASYWLFDRLRGLHRYARLPATLIALAFVATVAGLYGWQAHAQNNFSGGQTARWELLVDELQANYQDVPDGTTIYIIDGPWTNTMENYTWVPSVARALYGDASAFDLPRSSYETDPPSPRRAVFLEWRDGGLEPVSFEQVTANR